jgi:hypothetical protein
MNIFRMIGCYVLGAHEWTSTVQQNKLDGPVLLGDLKACSVQGAQEAYIVALFNHHCRMWCRHCGHFSELNEDKSTTPVPGCEPWDKAPRTAGK